MADQELKQFPDVESSSSVLEDALRQREDELKEAHRIARLGTWRWVRPTDRVTWSEEVYRIFGRDRSLPPPGYEELLRLHTPESRTRLETAVRLAVEQGIPYELDLELLQPYGTTKWITARGEACEYLGDEVSALRGTIQEITERRQNEERLALSENRYRSLVRAISEMVWTTTKEGNQVNELPEWQAFTGQTREEVAGFGWADAIHPEDREFTVVKWRDAIATGKTFELEQRLRRHDGAYRNMTVRAVPVRNGQGEIVEWVGMHVDITERKQTEAALREAQSRFSKLFDSDLMGICIPDRFGAFFEGNDEFLRVVGYTREDLEAGLVRWDIMTPTEYQEIDAAHIAEAAERGSCTPYEKEYIRKDGSRVPILCGYALLEGSRDQYIGFIQDMSPQKHAEAELREREQRFSALAESLPQLVWESNASGENNYCNQRFLQYTGLPTEQMMNMSFLSIIHCDDVDRTMENWRRCLATGEPYLNQYRLRRHDGEYRHFLARAVPVRNDDGEIERWLGSATDIHDQKLAEEALRRSEKLAAAGRLAASMAHEINNPLAAVTNALYLALQDETLGESTREYLRLADQELTRVAHVTTQTLRFHKQSSAPAIFDVVECMNSVISLFEPRLRSSGIAVTREYGNVKKLYCFGDELRQVFANLVSNSLDAMADGGRLRVRIRQGLSWDQDRQPGIKIIVADTGHGISRGLRKRVFEAFFSTKDATGTGLGLWVTEGILRKHRARIVLHSKTGREQHGTVFALFFPFDGLAGTFSPVTMAEVGITAGAAGR
jgi:PAS domain S-box-containing protein